MDRLDSMRIFVAVAEARSFAGGARALGLSGPAATRAVAALEQHLGARLLHRSTRLVRATEAGERFLVDCKRILADVDEAEALAAGAHAQPQGELSVTASVIFGRMYVAPLLLDFLPLHPRLAVRSLYVDRVVNLLEEGFDVAVRIAHLADSSLTATRVGWVRRVVVAAPAYLAARGEPQTPDDIAGHDAIGFSQADGPSAPWRFRRTGSQGSSPPASLPTAEALHEVPPPRMPLTVNAGDVAIAAARAGLGLTRALSYQVADDVHAGRLKIVLAEYEAAPIPIHLVYAEGQRASAKVRAFVDFAAQRLRANTLLNVSSQAGVKFVTPDADAPRAGMQVGADPRRY